MVLDGVIRRLVMAQLQGVVLETDPKDGWLTCKFRINTISATRSFGNEILLLTLSPKQLWWMVEPQELYRSVEQNNATEINEYAFYSVELS